MSQNFASTGVSGKSSKSSKKEIFKGKSLEKTQSGGEDSASGDEVTVTTTGKSSKSHKSEAAGDPFGNIPRSIDPTVTSRTSNALATDSESPAMATEVSSGAIPTSLFAATVAVSALFL